MALDKFITFAAVIVLFIFFSIMAKNFFTARSVLSLLLQTSAVTIMGIGVTFTIITGGIDLSIGSVIALAGTVAVMVAIAGVPIWLSMDRRPARRSRLRSPQWADGHQLKVASLHRDAWHDDGRSRGRTHHYKRQRLAGAGWLWVLGNDAIFRTGPKFPGISYPVLIMIAVAIIFSFILGKNADWQVHLRRGIE